MSTNTSVIDKLETDSATKTWRNAQDKLADENGLAIALVESKGLSAITVSNQNSICQTFLTSQEHSRFCEPFCGNAFQTVAKTGGSINFQCHAGLNCTALPIKTDSARPLVAIVGRSFRKTSEYSQFAERVRMGDWQNLQTDTLFDNVLISSTENSFERAAFGLKELAIEEKRSSVAESDDQDILELGSFEHDTKTNGSMRIETNERSFEKFEKLVESKLPQTTKNVETISTVGKSDIVVKSNDDVRKQPLAKNKEGVQAGADSNAAKKSRDNAELVEWRSLFNSLVSQNYNGACVSVMRFLAERYHFESMAWLERKNDKLQTILVGGNFKGQEISFDISTDDNLLSDAIRNITSVEMRDARHSTNSNQSIHLFPIAIDQEVRGAFVIGDCLADKKIRRKIAKFCHNIAPTLEILYLRDELQKREWLAKSSRKFNDGLKQIDTNDLWFFFTKLCAELLKAERCSILAYDEELQSLIVKSAVGFNAEKISKNQNVIGERVADVVWRSGRPVLVADVQKIGLPPAAVDCNYKSKSFISFPISIGDRKLGVLNVTDKVDGKIYDKHEIELLETIAPQIAIALDRANLQTMSGKYEQLAITDGLTGLLNRRYLDERLTEEVKRSKRNGYPMSFMMIDVDDFKSYNDSFLHTEGDKALQLVAQSLRATLRGADVAARYGGEEFSILLPQTTLSEAHVIAERIRQRIEDQVFPNRQVTVSVGVASFSRVVKTPQEIKAAADKALYQAKAKGKNVVQIFPNY